MTISEHELISRFGTAVDRHRAALFIGAGLSRDAGAPGWGELIEPLATAIGLPATGDMTLLAEYYEQEPGGGRQHLEYHLLSKLSKVATPGPALELVAALNVAEMWTTNFDPLLSAAVPSARVITKEDDAQSIGTGEAQVIRMHGGFDAPPGAAPGWVAPPVITRGDFERYDLEHPRLWAALQASYLTRTFLFLGFSMSDPNIELLLKLARRQHTADGNRHLVVLPRPSKAEEPREHDLRVADLERNGVAVCEIASHGDLIPLLEALQRRTRPLRLFVSGSGSSEQIGDWCDRIGSRIAPHRGWQVASLAGPAGWFTTRRVGVLRRDSGSYDPEELRFYFRKKENEKAPPLDDRIGTAVFTDDDRHPLVDDVIRTCRALVVIGGYGTSGRTLEEVEIALSAGLGVVPIPASGGAALTSWEAAVDAAADPRRRRLGGQQVPDDVWARLNSDDAPRAEAVAGALLAQAMYET